MKHLHVVSHPRRLPAQAVSLLEKALWLRNALDAVVVVQEISDLLTKSDSHDN